MGVDAQTLPTLVLDVGFQPINRTTVGRAVLLLLKGKAEIIERHDVDLRGDTRTATEQFRAPSVIRLLSVIPRQQSRGVKFSRLNVWRRDGGRCQYCGEKISLSEMTYDHVIPASRGGTRRFENVVACCYRDNQRKAGRTPEEAGMRLLRKPVRPRTLGAHLPFSTVVWTDGYPANWRQWLLDVMYWSDALDES